MKVSTAIKFYILLIATAVFFLAAIAFGAVEIPLADIFRILFGGEPENPVWRIIVVESRLPMATTALLSGAALSVAGLILQTAFRNPLAGPSILGVSSGASMGVAIVMLLGAALFMPLSALYYVSTILGALLGAAAVILLLLALSAALRSNAMLLIAGIMISYLATAVISLLNYFAPSESVKSYVVWGLGSFTGVSMAELPVFSIAATAAILATLLFVKPLNALLLGERYAANMGYSIRRLRTLLLSVSGFLTALITAFCGPIGFIGLVVPHIARLIFKTSNHWILMPATILCGACIALFCSALTSVPGSTTLLPVNAITPIVGVPVIFYIIVNRKQLRYFN